jgi:hypothetical protein
MWLYYRSTRKGRARWHFWDAAVFAAGGLSRCRRVRADAAGVSRSGPAPRLTPACQECASAARREGLPPPLRGDYDSTRRYPMETGGRHWGVRVKVKRRGGYAKWTSGGWFATWTEARRVAIDWEKQGHPAEVLFRSEMPELEQLELPIPRTA